MDILKKTYKRRNATDSDVFFATEMQGEFVIFSNGAKCKLSTLLTDFEQTASVNESSNSNTDNSVIDAEKFFNTPIANDGLLNQMEQLTKNPQTKIAGSNKLHESSSLDDDDRYEKVGPGGKTVQNNPNSIENRLANNDTVANPTNTQQTVNKKTNRLPEYDVFDNVKLSEEIEISVPFKIKLPKADRLDILNDMFKTSFTDYISKKYINDNIINNSVKLQGMIKKSIEDWIDSELSGKKTKKPKRNVKTTDALELIKTTDAFNTETIVAVDKPDESAMSFFAKGQQPVKAWDGDIKKLFAINTEEQYDAVKQKFVTLKENNPNSPDVDRFEGMLELYEESLKS